MVVTDKKNEQKVKSLIAINNSGIRQLLKTGELKYGFWADKMKTEADKISKPVGMTVDELYTRAFLSTLKQTENGGRDALPYNATNGFTKGEVNTFTDCSFTDCPEDYNTSPRDFSGTGHTQAGAYQILKTTWNDPYMGAEALGMDANNFSPLAQDEFIMKTINIKKHALSEVKSGDIEGAILKLRSEWRSLPGPQTQASHITIDTVKELFKKNVSNEINGNTNIDTPKRQLMSKAGS